MDAGTRGRREGGGRGRSGRTGPRGGAWAPGRRRRARGARGLVPDADELTGLIARLKGEMLTAAESLQFEEAALLRDEIAELRSMLTRDPVDGDPVLPGDSADVTAEAEV